MLFRRMKGVHVPHRKHTAAMPAVPMDPPPKCVTIPLSMHIGAPAQPVVKPGDKVFVGQTIAEAGGFVSAPVHASVSGVVKSVTEILQPNGRTCPAVVIESDGQNTLWEGIRPPEIRDYDSFLAAVRASGSVGLGGAGFPTAVKLAVKGKDPDALIINGAECEPYITSDTRTMLDETAEIIRGAAMVREYIAPKRVIFAIEANKPECVKKLRAEAPDWMEITVLPSLYPQGGEKVLIYHTVGRVVPEGKLPIDVGCVVLNCTTLAFLCRYAETGIPLVEKVVTVDGGVVAHPANLRVPVGTSMQDVFDACGGFTEEPDRILYGGPMMGTTVPSADRPILKSTNAILALSAAETATPDPTPCIRCGNCVLHCPLRLNPQAVSQAYAKKDVARMVELKINLCMECGCCSYICPAKRPLVQTNRLAKAQVMAYLKEQKEKKENEQKEKEAHGA